jgi:aminoglycoside phosphotransferase (APT) family kinase protein
MQKRLGDVYEIHPEFDHSSGNINDVEICSIESLLKQASEYEKQFPAPFSVYIHGDFNLDNILYDPARSRVKFIDLHRSQYFDYVQDVTVFMVSIYRLQILDPVVRKRMMKLARDFCHFARRYARRSGDKTFEIRLALGLARSFATSTRFILDKSLARKMFLRARYLIEQVLVVESNKAHKYRTPVKELFIG